MNIKKPSYYIYPKLPPKTKSGFVQIHNVLQQRGVGYAKSIGGIFSLRVNGFGKHFGNPFSSVPSEIAKGLVATNSVRESVEKYIDWILVDKIHLTNQNLFTVTPKKSIDEKAVIKASIATKFIGFGEGIMGSSTELYRTQIIEQNKYGLENSGLYSCDDFIFVSIVGKRGGEKMRREQQDKTIREALKAVRRGAVLITDNESYVDSSSYNEGEKRLASALKAEGCSYSEQIIDGHKLGLWKKHIDHERVIWLRWILKSGNLRGTPIIYYKELGEPSHANALDFLINEFDWKNFS